MIFENPGIEETETTADANIIFCANCLLFIPF